MKFETLFRYRKQYMALAILQVMTYHMKGNWPDGPLKTALFLFVGSVDTFFFVSGIGCFFSWQRERDPAVFLRRRALRILPTYLPFILVWITAQAFTGGISLNAALANLLGVNGFMKLEPSFNWYVSGMWLSYLLTPWLADLAERCGSKRRAALAIAGLLLASAAFWQNYELIIMASRLPVFFLGMLFAAESRRREGLERREIVLMLALVPLGGILLWECMKYWPDRLWNYGLGWYPFLLMVPGICAAVAGLCSALERFAAGRALSRGLSFLGGITFELYLTHFCLTRLSLPVFLLLTAAGTALLVGVSRLIRGRLEKRRTA